MKDKIFLDTNILIYQFSSDEFKKNIAIGILEESFKSSNYVISYQVIQEFSNIAINKNKPYFSHSELKHYIEDILIPLCKFYPSPNFYLESLNLKSKYNFSYYDTLIIKAALEMNCKYLYSEDFQHNQKISSLKIINPFLMTR
jgi:predicted nucleic acid-binding protein